jgi:hypothetical protein
MFCSSYPCCRCAELGDFIVPRSYRSVISVAGLARILPSAEPLASLGNFEMASFEKIGTFSTAAYSST